MKRNESKCNPYATKLLVVLTVLALFICIFFLNSPTRVQAQLSTPKSGDPDYLLSQVEITNPGSFENNKVYVGIWLINIYSFSYVSGSYTFDMYVYFFWVNPNITQIEWYLMNGYPITPISTILIEKSVSDAVKYEIYRTTARLSSSPDGSDFPFDTIKLPVTIEILKQGLDLSVEWLENETGIDPGFSNSGWETVNFELFESVHDYPLDAHLPKVEMVLTQQRRRPATVVQSLFPPLIFGMVSACSFLFSLRDSSAVGLRLGLNTSMLVTTLLFNFAISGTIPPSSTFILYDLFMFSVLIFIALNLVVTTIGFVSWFYFKNEKRTRLINRLGFLLSLIAPILFFILLFFLRS